MEIDRKVYNIVVISDDNFVQHTGVMLTSLFCQNKEKRFCVFYLTTNISNINKDLLNEVCRGYNVSIEYCICSQDRITNLSYGSWSSIIYLKLMIPIVLPRQVERCLFIDGDIIVHDDIGPLYDMEMDGYVLAAVEDNPDGELHKKRLGLSSMDVYINSGVFLCDLNAWRTMQSSKDIIEFAHSIAGKIINEQDVIACYFRGKILLLPIRWNMVTHFFLQKPKIYDKYLNDLSTARKNPGIIHFCAPIKPWFRDCDHPYGYLYRRYLAQTPWSTFKFPVYEHLTLIQKINKYIKIILNNLGLRKDDMIYSLK